MDGAGSAVLRALPLVCEGYFDLKRHKARGMWASLIGKKIIRQDG